MDIMMRDKNDDFLAASGNNGSATRDVTPESMKSAKWSPVHGPGDGEGTGTTESQSQASVNIQAEIGKPGKMISVKEDTACVCL